MTRKRNGIGRNGTGSWGFNFATIVQVFAIPVLTGMIYLFTQWITTGDTLRRHSDEILQNQSDIKNEGIQRDKNRTEFLDKISKLNEGINTLNTNVALQGQILAAIKDELAKKNNDRGR